jgi:hypothetical protein
MSPLPPESLPPNGPGVPQDCCRRSRRNYGSLRSKGVHTQPKDTLWKIVALTDHSLRGLRRPSSCRCRFGLPFPLFLRLPLLLLRCCRTRFEVYGTKNDFKLMGVRSNRGKDVDIPSGLTQPWRSRMQRPHIFPASPLHTWPYRVHQ